MCKGERRREGGRASQHYLGMERPGPRACLGMLPGVLSERDRLNDADTIALCLAISLQRSVWAGSDAAADSCASLKVSA